MNWMYVEEFLLLVVRYELFYVQQLLLLMNQHIYQIHHRDDDQGNLNVRNEFSGKRKKKY
jgi:hypothetical protein